jgi:trypsin
MNTRLERLSRLALLLAACCGCGPVSGPRDPSSGVTALQQPILNGSFDQGDPATVLLGGGGGWSTGALVSPRVILTCGHCVDSQERPRSFAYFGSSYLDGGTIVPVERSYPHPSYVSGTFPNVDIGIVILKRPVDVRPLGIQATPLDGGIVGAPLRIVGFGATSPAMPEFSKMEVTVPITGLDPYYLLVGPAICAGDSGGPGILFAGTGQDVIAGVVSWHTANAAGCGGSGGLTRVDLHAGWIREQIDAAEDAGVGDEPLDGGSTGGDGGADPDSGTPPDAGDGAGPADAGAEPSTQLPLPDSQNSPLVGGCSAAGGGGGDALLALLLGALLGQGRARRRPRSTPGQPRR